MVGGGKDREEMSRLIDADVLIEILKEEKKRDRSKVYGEHECDLIIGTIAMCIDYVKATPTAFDTEKVVEQLEEKIEITWKHDYMGGRKDAFNEAIDIVKKGGVE